MKVHGTSNTAQRSSGVQRTGGSLYWVTFIDDAGRFKAVQFLRKKSEAFGAFRVFKAYAEKALGRKIKMLRDDKGGEYM